MTPLIVGAFAAATFAISAWLTHLFCNPASAVYVLDHPNERSLHTRPTPRTGGLAILIAIAVSAVLLAVYFGEVKREAAWLGGGAGLVAGVSFLDDRYALSPVLRLALHVIAATMLVYDGFVLSIPAAFPGIAWAVPIPVMAGVSLLYVVWMLNLYNFMDGMDGFAGGMTVLGFGTFAIMGWLAGHELFFIMNLIVAAAAAGFLVFNFPPARIFMGDVGSSTLGFLAAAFSLWGANDGVFPFWIALLVFSPFIVDATVTLLRRLWRREKVWRAHKTHYYQRLVQAGWGHRKTVLAEYVIMLGCGITALGVLHAPVGLQVAAFVGWTLFYFLFFFWVLRYAVRHGKTKVL